MATTEPSVVVPPAEQAPATKKTTKDNSSGPTEEWTTLCTKVVANEVDMVTIEKEATGDLGELATALCACTSVNRIVVSLDSLPKYQATLFSILEILKTAKILKSFELTDVDFGNSAVVVAATVLLEAVGKNKNIKDVTVECRGKHSLEKFHSLKKFKRQNVPISIFPKALGACSHLQSVWLEHMDEIILEQTLLAMRKCKHLKVLSLVLRHYSRVTFESLGMLIRRSSSMETLELHEIRMTTRRFQPVTTALEAGKVKEIAFHHCRFTRAATELLVGLNDKLSNSRLETLVLGRGVRCSRPTIALLSTMLANNRWKSLDLKHQVFRREMPALLQMLTEQSQLENLVLGKIESGTDIDHFTAAVPKIKGLCTLTIDVPEGVVDRVTEAIRSNSNVESCCINDKEVTFKAPGVVEQMRDFKANRVSDDDYQGMFAEPSKNEDSCSPSESQSEIADP